MGDFERTFGAGADAASIIDAFSREEANNYSTRMPNNKPALKGQTEEDVAVIKQVNPKRDEVIFGDYTFEMLLDVFSKIEHFNIDNSRKYRAGQSSVLVIDGFFLFLRASEGDEHPFKRNENIYNESIKLLRYNQSIQALDHKNCAWEISIDFWTDPQCAYKKQVSMLGPRFTNSSPKPRLYDVSAKGLKFEFNVLEELIITFIKQYLETGYVNKKPPAMIEDWASSGLDMWVRCMSCRRNVIIPSEQIMGRFRKGGLVIEAGNRLKCRSCDPGTSWAKILPDIAQL